jgi:capsular polysaccharide transport system permease protein
VSFILMVVAPSLAAITYYGFVASDQYVAEARFTLRGGTAPKLDSLAALTGVPAVTIIQDTQIVMNYIQSRAIIETLEPKLQLRQMFSRPEVDSHSRFEADQSIEKFLKYWKSTIETSVQMPSGIVVLTARAFTPEDAVQVAKGVLSASESLVNDMNDRMRQDALALAEQEQQRALERLTKARTDLERARNEEGTLNAESTAEVVNGLIGGLRTEFLKMQQDYETQKRYMSEASPQLRTLQTRMNAISEQIGFLQAKLTRQSSASGNDKTLSNTMSKLDQLELERQLSEKLYASSIAALERARLASESKMMYLNTFVQPVIAQEARYPRRAWSISVIVVVSLLAWSAVSGVVILARNHMA